MEETRMAENRYEISKELKNNNARLTEILAMAGDIKLKTNGKTPKIQECKEGQPVEIKDCLIESVRIQDNIISKIADELQEILNVL